MRQFDSIMDFQVAVIIIIIKIQLYIWIERRFIFWITLALLYFSCVSIAVRLMDFTWPIYRYDFIKFIVHINCPDTLIQALSLLCIVLCGVCGVRLCVDVTWSTSEVQKDIYAINVLKLVKKLITEFRSKIIFFIHFMEWPLFISVNN